MGQKPLYVSQRICSPTQTAIAFASEPSPFCTLDWFNDNVHDDRLRDFLCQGYIGDESSIYRLTEKVAPALWRSFKFNVVSGDYYFWPNEPREGTEQAETAMAHALVTRVVHRQLVADVPLGCLLSGGIDSSVIAACARSFGPISTFSIAFDDPRYDESRYAREVAAHLGTDHHEFRVTPNVAEDLPKLAAVFGEPFADSSAIPTHYLARETRKHVKVALSGDGGDDLFGGYDRYRAIRLAARLRARPLRRVVATVARPWSLGHPKSRFTRAARFLSSVALDDAQRYDSYMRIFDDATIRELLGQETGRCPGVEEVFRRELARTGDPVRAALATDRVTYLPDDLLTKLDRASMLHNLEVRSPFMDHELVQFAAGLTTDQLLKGGPKRMLREAFAKDLPDFVFKRPKMGFAVPIGEWFRGELRPMLRDNLFAADSFARQHFNMKVVERLVDEHESMRGDHSQRLYALLMLELWWQWHRSA
jgi:asparagine synthase (glutamine-hydrolysing)